LRPAVLNESTNYFPEGMPSARTAVMTEQLKERSIVKKQSKLVALIDEETCTGCEVCIEFCPVDCIILLPNPNPELRNNVCRDVEGDCTGCTLCVKECPWECITMVPRERGQNADWGLQIGEY